MGGFWRHGFVVLVDVISLLLLLADQSTATSFAWQPVECDGLDLERIGCFADNYQDPRPLPQLLFTDIDEHSLYYSGQKLNMPDPDTYMVSLICRCAQQAISTGYNLIGLQEYGECMSGENSVTKQTYNRDGPSEFCMTWKGEPCQAGLDCVGEDSANFIYKVKDKLLPTVSVTAQSTGRPRKPSLTPFPRPTTTKNKTRPTVHPPFPSPLVTSTAPTTGSPPKTTKRPFPRPWTTKKTTKPPFPSPLVTGTSTAPTTGSPPKTTKRPFPRPWTTKKTTKSPFPSPSVTSTAPTTGSPPKTNMKPFPRPWTTKKTTKPPFPSPLVTGTSTAPTTGIPTRLPSTPSNRPPQKLYPQCIPQCYRSYTIRYVPVPQQTPSYQVPQSTPLSTCPHLTACPTMCYPACSFACCRSKLGKKTTKAEGKPKKTKMKRRKRRAVLADLNDVF